MKNNIIKITILSCLFFIVEYLNTGSIKDFINYISFFKIIYTSFWIITIFSFLTLIFRSERISSKITIIIITILAISNYVKINSMYTTFKISDIFLIKSGLYFASGMNAFSFTIPIIISLIIFVFSLLLTFFLKKDKINIKLRKNQFKTVIYIILSIVLLLNISVKTFQHYLNNKMQFNFDKNTILNAQKNGFLPLFLTTLNNKFVDYKNSDQESVNEAYKYFVNEYKPKNKIIDADVDVIFIMSESFSDPYKLYPNLNLNEDLMPNIRKIQKDSVMFGTFSSIAQSGGTCNVEFEVMTGYLNAFTPDGLCFETKQPVRGIVSDFNELGYNTVGIHPAPSKLFYDRNNTFKNLGFKNTVFEEDLKNNFDAYKYYGEGAKNDSAWTRYMSDESFYQIILENSGKKDLNHFIYGISMQNHAPFLTTQEYFSNHISFDLKNKLNKPILERYFLGLKETDIATQKFIDEINKREKKTMVVFYGDHPINYNLFESEKNQTLEENPENYHTPYFVYTNFKVDKVGEINNVSPGELSIKIEQMFGIDNTRIRAQDVFYNKVKSYTKTHAFINNLYNNPLYRKDDIFEKFRTIFDDDFFGQNYYKNIKD